jgi:hypothetical protein
MGFLLMVVIHAPVADSAVGLRNVQDVVN